MPSMPILIKKGMIVTVNQSSDILQGDILVKDSKIVKIGIGHYMIPMLLFLMPVTILSHLDLFKPTFIFARHYFAILLTI